MKNNNGVIKGILIGVGASIIVALIVIAAIVFVKSRNTVADNDNTDMVEDEDFHREKKKKEKEKKEVIDEGEILASNVARKMLQVNFDSDFSYTLSVPAYQTEAGCANVVNADRFYLPAAVLDRIAQDNFIVANGKYAEFFDLYEDNRYLQLPSFITTDSIMHTYHLYFAMLQKNTEMNYLYDSLNNLTLRMYEQSLDIYDELLSTRWEEAASKSVAFFAVAARLLDNQIQIPDGVSDMVLGELSNIEAQDGIKESLIIKEMEDYSQYKPRGYYEENEKLSRYFQAMMWYGRRNFKQSDDEESKTALLINLAMDDEAYQNWEQIYSITSFFAGASDDCGYYEYQPLIVEAYGKKVSVKKLAEDDKAWEKYKKSIAQLEAPKINSCVFEAQEGADRLEQSKGYRFMGQRFTLDAAIFTNLCYEKVLENEYGEQRVLPYALDVPAAMGSDVALSILEDRGEFSFENYEKNMEELRETIANAPDTIWSASLYGAWLNTLNPLLQKKGEGYPSFMTNEAWARKSVENYLGSFTELKHDTVLYSKQFMAEMGGGDDEEYDTRGYVEPEVELYNRLMSLTQDTIDGLDEYGIISSTDKDNLKKLYDIVTRLRDISVKELAFEDLTESEYEFIEEYGGNLEHLWRETITDVTKDSYVDCSEYPCALVTDVATDPNGTVLQEAIGGASTIYVVVPIDGELHLTKGAVFTYYEFYVPIDERMTDSDWRQMLGMELTDDMEYVGQNDLPYPEWTDMYRLNVYDYYDDFG